MTDSPPPAPPLQVIETIVRAVKFVWQGRNDFMNLAFPAVLVLSVLNTGVALVVSSPVVQDLAPETEQVEQALRINLLPFILLILPFGYFWTTFAIGWHRRYLLPKEHQTVRQILTWRSRHTRYLLYAIGVTMIIATIVVVGASIAVFAPVLMVLVLGAAGVVYARFSQVLPSASIDHGLTLAESWALTQGNTSRIFAAIVATWLPVIVVVSVAERLLILALGGSETFMALFVRAFVGNFVGYIGVAVGVSLLSLIYDHLRVGQGPSVDLKIF